MQGRWISLVLLAALAVSCGRGDRLSPGDVAITTGPEGVSGVALEPLSGENLTAYEKSVPLGTKVRIVDDKESGGNDPSRRRVRINVMEGKKQGQAGTVYRKNLLLLDDPKS